MPAAISRSRKRRKLKAEINVVPYIDVMLVLLIIFMVTAPLLTLSIDVDLPTSNAKALESKQDPIIVTVRGDGQLALTLPDGDPQAVDVDALQQRLAAFVAQDKNTRVVVAADKTVPFQHVVAAMDAIKHAKVDKVGLLTDSGGNAR